VLQMGSRFVAEESQHIACPPHYKQNPQPLYAMDVWDDVVGSRQKKPLSDSPTAEMLA
jgi:hypothetical protein